MEVALPVPAGQLTVDLPVVRHFLLFASCSQALASTPQACFVVQ